MKSDDIIDDHHDDDININNMNNNMSTDLDALNTDDNIRLSTGSINTRSSSIDYKRMVTVYLYDTLDSKSIDLFVDSNTTAEEICQQIRIKTDPETIDLRCFSLVLIISILKTYNNSYLHYLRTLKNHECLNEIKQLVIDKQMQQFHQRDKSSLDITSRWYFKDIRTNPIELNESGDIMGETSSDDEEEISQSDLSYLAKSERKGYLLKRSNTDSNLWRKWYCVLLDQLWCIDITKEVPTCKCIKLTGMIRYREGYRALDQLQIIIINSDNLSHYFRAFNIVEQRNWIQDLNDKTNQLPENNFFSIAEVIIADEESARCQRVMKQLDGVLNGTKMMEALGLHKSIDLSQLSSRLTSDTTTTTTTITITTTTTTNNNDTNCNISSNSNSSYKNSGTNDDEGNRSLILTNNNRQNSSNSNSNSNSNSHSPLLLTGRVHAIRKILSTKKSNNNNNDNNNNNNNNTSNYNRGHKGENDVKYNLDDNRGDDGLDSSNSDKVLTIGITSDSSSKKSSHLNGDINIISTISNQHGNSYDHEDVHNHHHDHHDDVKLKHYHSNYISVTNNQEEEEEEDDDNDVVVGGSRVDVDLCNYNMCNHLEQTGLIHRLYRENRSLFELIHFVIHVQRFRELFRHELSVSTSIQRHYARDVYITYLLPQLQLSEIELSEQFHDHIIKLGGEDIMNIQQQQQQQVTKKNKCDNWGIDVMELLRIHQSICLVCFNATVSIHDLTATAIVNVTGEKLLNDQQLQLQQANDISNFIEDGQQQQQQQQQQHSGTKNNDNNQIDEKVTTLRSPTSPSTDPNNSSSNSGSSSSNNSSSISTKGNIPIDTRGNHAALLKAPPNQSIHSRPTSSLSSSFWSNWFHPNSINTSSSSGRSSLFSSKPTNTTNTPSFSSFSPDTSPRTMIWREVSSSSSKSHPSSISDEDNNLTAPDVELFDSVLRTLYGRLS